MGNDTWPGDIVSVTSTTATADPRLVRTHARSPSARPSDSASAGAIRSAPWASFLRQPGRGRSCWPSTSGARRRTGRTGSRASLPAGAGSSASTVELVEQHRDGEGDAAVGCLQAAHRLVVVVDGERDARRVRQDGVEQRLAQLDAVAVDAGAADRVRVGERAAGGRGPTAPPRRPPARRRASSASGRASRTAAPGAACRGRAASAPRPRKASRYARRPCAAAVGERREVVVGVGAERAAQAGVDLGLGQRAGHRLEDRAAEVEDVARELEVEERALPLLELRRRREHVVGLARRLGQGDVDDDDEVEGVAAPRASARCRRASAPGSPTRRAAPGSGPGGR